MIIAYPNGCCAGCECQATREIIDECGDRTPLCERCPSPEEIRERSAAVREEWDDLEHWCRRHGVSREFAIAVQAVVVDSMARGKYSRTSPRADRQVPLAL